MLVEMELRKSDRKLKELVFEMACEQETLISWEVKTLEEGLEEVCLMRWLYLHEKVKVTLLEPMLLRDELVLGLKLEQRVV